MARRPVIVSTLIPVLLIVGAGAALATGEMEKRRPRSTACAVCSEDSMGGSPIVGTGTKVIYISRP